MKIDISKRVRHVEGEHIVVRQEGNVSDMTSVISLNATAMELYDAFAGRDFSVADVVDYLVAQFDVEAAVAMRDAKEWVARMREQKLIVD